MLFSATSHTAGSSLPLFPSSAFSLSVSLTGVRVDWRRDAVSDGQLSRECCWHSLPVGMAECSSVTVSQCVSVCCLCVCSVRPVSRWLLRPLLQEVSTLGITGCATRCNCFCRFIISLSLSLSFCCCCCSMCYVECFPVLFEWIKHLSA